MNIAHAFQVSAFLVCPLGWLLRRSPSAPRIIIMMLASALAGEILMRFTGADMALDWLRPDMIG